MKKSRKKITLCLVAVLLGWIIFAQSCMKFRISDSKARVSFEQQGVPAGFHYTGPGTTGLHYVKTGSDTLPTLFFVHGSPGSWNAFMQYMTDGDLLQRFRMISVDRPGFGYSSFGAALHLPEQANMLSEVIRIEHNQQPVHLVGHSIGGPVIVQMAQDKPASVASLTILAGSVSPEHEPREYWRYLFKYSPLSWLLPGAFRPSNLEIIYFKKDLLTLDTGYHALQMPVTFIHGEKDSWVPVGNVDYGKQQLLHNRDTEAIIIPGGGHFIPWRNYHIIKEHLLRLNKKQVDRPV